VKPKAENVARENEELKAEVGKLGLKLDGVWTPTPGDPDLENVQLRLLLEWVRVYRALPDRRKLEKRGYCFPPIDPDCDPDTDWVRFERWVKGRPLTWRFTPSDLSEFKNPAEVTDAEAESLLEKLLGKLEDRDIAVDIHDGVPARLAYALVRKEAESEFEVTAPGTTTHIGCSAYCPECVQRPWCEVGREESWPEDEEAGHRVVTPEVAPYLAPDRRHIRAARRA